MKFKSTFFPDAVSFASTLRVRPSRDRTMSACKKHTSSIFSSKINKMNQRLTSWRVSPVTGQLEQRCTFSESEEPQSRPISA
ncbi:hypothetical protein FH968_18255 [Buttiauxella sp. B2]|nr:hypothetical protein FH968_18255 [Buttiauxella sp. B2]